jgi:hypothetical protein
MRLLVLLGSSLGMISSMGPVAGAAPPSAPKDVRHTERSPAHLRIEWTDVAADETGYRIWRRKAGDKRWYLAGETGSNATRFDDGGAQEQTAYEHEVAAFNISGEGQHVQTPGATSTLPMTAHLEPQIVIPAGNTYPADPSALTLKDDRLLLVYAKGEVSHRRERWNQSLWQMVSADEGRTWSAPRLVVQGGQETVYGKPALVRIPDGRLGLSYSCFGLDPKGKIVQRRRQFVSSGDEGATWSRPVDMSASSSNNDTLIVGDRGRLLQALTDYDPAARIVASDDGGATWWKLAEVAAVEAARPTGEAALVNAGAGRLIFLSRHEAPFYCLSDSDDNGQTWGSPHTLYLGGGDNPPKIVRLPGGNTLAAIVHSWYQGAKSKDRRQLASVISEDGGRTWGNFRLIGYAADGKDGFLQHSVTFAGDVAYLFYGGGSRNDTGDGIDLRLIRLHKQFFTSTIPWPYDWRGSPER